MKKIIATTLVALTAGISVANAQTGSIVSNSEIWQKLHQSIEQKGFKWVGIEKNYLNSENNSNILMNQNFIGFGQNFGNVNFLQNILNETKQVDLAEIYKNFRIEIEKIFEANNNVDKIDLIQTKEQAIVALKKFDTAISNAKALPKNIFFTEYPDFIKIYYKFFANENMSDFAQNENIEFLKEYSKIVAGKNRDDIGFVTSYAPNFNYIFPFGNEKIATENDRINIDFDIFTVDGNKLNWNDLEVDLNYKEKFYSAKRKQNWYFRFVLIWLDKTKKYDFSVSVKKPNSNTVLNKDFSFEFEKSKVIETILFYKLNNYEVWPWKIKVNDDVLDVGPIDIVINPYWDMLLHSARKSSDNSSVDWIYLTENDKKPEYFLDSEKYWLYDFLKFYSKK